jgi:hypothetical protein
MSCAPSAPLRKQFSNSKGWQDAPELMRNVSLARAMRSYAPVIQTNWIRQMDVLNFYAITVPGFGALIVHRLVDGVRDALIVPQREQ